MASESISVLVVEDEPAIAELVAFSVKGAGFTPVKVYSGAEAWATLQRFRPDVVLLDWMLPDLSGMQLLARIREHREMKTLPVIMLTARGEGIDKINGLSIGADDYMTKPFQPLELVARVKAQLRRYKCYNAGPEHDSEIIVLSGLSLDIKSHTCTLNEHPLSLTPTEFSILQILCQNKGRVVSSEELFRQIWKDEYYTKNNNTITAHIRHLREKMGDSYENPKYIKTVWGYGYKIEN